MSSITFTIDFSGTPDELDRRAATKNIEDENTRRAADLDENGDPILPPLPYGTGAELKASYLGLLGETITRAHISYYEQQAKQSLTETAKPLWEAATDAQRQAAITALGG